MIAVTTEFKTERYILANEYINIYYDGSAAQEKAIRESNPVPKGFKLLSYGCSQGIRTVNGKAQWYEYNHHLTYCRDVKTQVVEMSAP